MWNLYGIWWVDSRIGICGFKSSWFPLWQDDPKNDFVNTHDAPYDDVRFLGTKKRSGAIFSKFQKATGEGKRPEVWRCPKYMLFGVTRITKSFVFFFSNWNLIPTRKKMMIHSTKQFARYEGLWRFPNFGDTGRDTPKNHPGFHRIFHEWHQPSVFGPNLWRHYRDGPEEKHGAAGGRTLWMGTPERTTKSRPVVPRCSHKASHSLVFGILIQN